MIKHQHRINNPDSIDETLIESLLKEGKDVIVQFVAETFTDAMFVQLEKLCAKHDESFGIRFYGYYHSTFDCRIVRKIPSVKTLYIDSLSHALNTDALGELDHLQKLSIGIQDLKDTEVLRFDNFKKVKELYLVTGGGASSKSINLEYLKDYKNLTFLIFTGKAHNMDEIGSLGKLEQLNLNSVSKAPLGFLSKNKNLKTLRITLGGRENLNEIISTNIEHLEIVWVRGFKDLNALSRFSKLKTLLVENQAQLKKIDFTHCSKDIEKILLINCKNLSEVKGLEELPKLKVLHIYKTNLDPETYLNKDFSKTLKDFTLMSGKNREDKRNAKVLLEMGFPTQIERFRAADELEKDNK